jgi:hypothetical protein
MRLPCQTWYTTYVHVTNMRFPIGTLVGRGDWIADVGSGHLHLEVLYNGTYSGNARNPYGIDNAPYDGCLWLDSVFCPNSTVPVIPDGYTKCADEEGRCNFSGTADVIYGAYGVYTAPLSFTDGVNCNNGVFGDPISGATKACYFRSIGPVLQITSITRANPNPTSAAGVDFTVAFSESVKDVDKNDFALTTTGALNGVSVTSVSGGPSLYTVSVNTGTGSGDLRLDLPASATITNLSGTPLTGLPYTSGESYTVDKTVAASGLLQLQGIPVENSQACASVNASGGGAFGGGFFGPVYTDRNGAFTLFGLPIVGTYTFRSTYPGYLMAEKAGVSVMSPLDLGKATLRGGDVNGDNAVNILDIGRILSLFGHAGVPVRSVNCSDPDEAVAINNDGLVNISDLAITAGNWGKTGPTPWQP